jgi:DNA-binding TFAR19-related protein (PDSD5 family)
VPEKPEIERLRRVQERRAQQESEEAEQATEPAERRAHERRADKAAYLRDRLDDQAAAPDE